jgi:hypothetical protein
VNKRCEAEDDAFLRKYRWQDTGILLEQHVTEVRWPPWQRRPLSATCRCGTETTRQVCVHCHNDLPALFAAGESRIIAIVGAKQTGKSHYVTVLIHELHARVGRDFGAALNALDDDTEQRYREDFYNPVYEVHEKPIPSTDSASRRPKTRYPLLFQFTVPKRSKILGRQVNRCSLVFFDPAGEDLERDRRWIDKVARYIGIADGLIFLLDPLQTSALREKLRDTIPLPEIHAQPVELLGTVIQTLRESNAIPPHHRIRIPAALVCSKFDAVRDLLDASSPLREHSRHPGYLNRGDQERVNAALRASMSHWFGPELDQTIQSHFAQSAYFCVSALGWAPRRDGMVTRGVAPFRVADPFLWILHSLGMIEGRE